MKFKNYLKFLKIYFLFNLVLGIVFFILFAVGAKGVFQMLFYNQAGSTIVRILKAVNGIAGRIPFLLETFLVSLTGFFIAKNFKIIYGSLKKYF